MELYFTILFILSCFSILEVANIKLLTQKIVLICFSLVCLLLGGIRYNTGTDWGTYYIYFYRGYSFDYFMGHESFEAGYAILNYIIKALTNEYNLLLFFISFICIVCYYKSVISLTKYSITAAMIIYASDFYGIFPVRTTIVVALAMLAYVFIERKQKYYFLILVLLATSIHRIAIILLPAYWIYYRKWGNKKIFILIITSIVIGYSNMIFDFALSITGIDSIYLSKFISYAERSAAGQQFGSAIDKNELSYYMVMLKCFFLIVILRFRPLLESRIPFFNGLFNLFLFGNCVYFLLVSTSSEIAIRMTGVYNVSQYLLLAGMLNIFQRFYFRLIIWLGVFFMCVMKLLLKFNTFPDAYVPYTNILGI